MAFWDNIKFPYFNSQQLNLDWILTEIKRVMGFFPEDGNAGEVLMKTSTGTSWEEIEAIDININNLPQDTEIADTDKLIYYDISASANRKITPPDMLNSMMSNATPLMDGTGSAGTSKKPARYDHRHPSDTSKQNALSGTQLAACNSGITAAKVDKLDAVYDYQTGVQTIDGWTVVDYASGYREAYITAQIPNQVKAGTYNNINYCGAIITFPAGLFYRVVGAVATVRWGTGISWGGVRDYSTGYVQLTAFGNQDNETLYYTVRMFGFRPTT
jgi:hypothetical protein